MATAVILLAGTFITGAILAGPLGARPQRRSTELRVQTDLVAILASVTDQNGQPIPDLTQDSFQVSEEGVPQKIARFEAQTDRPLDLALMIDSSMSAFKDLRFEADASGRFIRQVVRPGDALAVYEFDESVTKLSNFSDDVPRLQAAVRKIVPGSGTSIYDAVELASDSLSRLPQGRRRAIVLVTDGGETTSVAKFDDTRRAAIKSGALLYTIIVRAVNNENGRNTAGEHALITITDSTGGALFILEDANQISQMFDRINRELRTQYLLGYYPSPTPPPGSDRHVHVQVKGDYVVRYRKEYFTPVVSQ
ncbi:MAG TPA: VWA domain-containing protein [Candidatus Acidoferrales bacterium]